MSDPVFFEPSRLFTAGEVALLTGAELADPALSDRRIARLAALGEGGGDALVYAEAKMRLGESGEVAAVLCKARLAADAPKGAAVLVTEKPRAAFVQVARLMYPAALNPGPVTGETGISPASHVSPEARLEEGVVVEAGAVVGPGAEIGAGTVVAPNAVIGSDCRIGRGCHVGPGATIQFALIGDKVIVGPGARIGSDGFGYIPGAGGAEKVPQFGRVIIQDRVEIGANTTIDRGAISDTVIGEGTKIDNLVQIAHNVRIGRHCLIAGHCGISGSSRLGDGVMLGGRVGVADHVSIGDGAALAATSGVMDDVPAGERWYGTPAMPLKQFMRQLSVVRKLARSGADGKKRDG